MPLREIEISSASYGDLNGTKIYLTERIHNKLSRVRIGRGDSMLVRLQNGRAVRGFKHLVTVIKQKNRENKIILTDQRSKVHNNNFHINYEEYIKHGDTIFYPFYRETGLNVAQSFLAKKCPSLFEEPDKTVSQKELKKVEDDLPNVIKKLSKKIKTRKQLIEQTSNMLKELREEKQVLKKEIEGLQVLQQQSSIFLYSEKLKEFKNRLTQNIHETKGKNSWQNWIYENSWLFGIHYQKPIQKEKVGFDSIPDYLFPTLDGFLDILEIKRPKYEAIRKDQSHADSFVWSSDTNKAIGQVITYITEIELNQLQLKERINQEYEDIYESKIFTIKPRAFILIGTSEDWKEKKKEAFRKLNYSLHGIEVLTYTDLYKRGEKIIQMYSEKSNG